ncbi:MAG: chalcone isomerase family protein [Myxococcota bacterium]
MKAMQLLTVLAVLLTSAATAQAKDAGGFDFPDTLTAAGQTLKLVGVGVRVKWMVDVYGLGAYQLTPTRKASHLINSDEPKAAWLHMLRTISGDKMRDAIDAGLEDNATEAERARMAPEVDRLKNAFPAEIRKGLDIFFVYQPGRGMTLKVGGVEKLTVTDRKLAVAMWSMWFGKNPVDKDMKNAILGD